jgi:hypothetical protein
MRKDKKPNFGLWNNFRLLFRPMNYSIDYGVKVSFKELNGHIFVMRIDIVKESK